MESQDKQTIFSFSSGDPSSATSETIIIYHDAVLCPPGPYPLRAGLHEPGLGLLCLVHDGSGCHRLGLLRHVHKVNGDGYHGLTRLGERMLKQAQRYF